MNRQMDSANISDMNNQLAVSGWSTDTELVRKFDRPINIVDAVCSTVDEAIQQWSELSETPPLYQFVNVENLDGLFKTKATDSSGWLPSAEFQFQSCRVTLLYSSSIRVIIERDP
jgi:hypothetical protein